jgi:hypothetical protein
MWVWGLPVGVLAGITRLPAGGPPAGRAGVLGVDGLARDGMQMRTIVCPGGSVMMR